MPSMLCCINVQSDSILHGDGQGVRYTYIRGYNLFVYPYATRVPGLARSGRRLREEDL